jgi:hypothetical protein
MSGKSLKKPQQAPVEIDWDGHAKHKMVQFQNPEPPFGLSNSQTQLRNKISGSGRETE